MRKKTVKTMTLTALIALAAAAMLAGCGKSDKTAETGADAQSNKLYVYNWGEYIDEDVEAMFEEETGIDVVYDVFETNEEMFPIIEAGGVKYDVVCPSDYMIQRMIQNDMLAPLNFDNLPNVKEIGPEYMEMSKDFDPENKYSVPYCWGTVGILYNKQRLEELGVPAPTKWADLWDERLSGEILMQNSVRDAFMVALKSKGYSLNSTNEAELAEARDLLIAQKPLVQAYVIDQVRDKMIGGEAALGVIYSGEALVCQQQNPDLDYVVPKEGSNIWIDSWVIPKNAENKENAEKFLDFLCRPDIAAKNFEYITYYSPVEGVKEYVEDEYLLNSPLAFPDPEQYTNCTTFHYLGEEADEYYNEIWREVQAAGTSE